MSLQNNPEELQNHLIEQIIQRAEQAAQQTQQIAQKFNEQLQQTQLAIEQAVQLAQSTVSNGSKYQLEHKDKETKKFVTSNISNLWQAYISNSIYVVFNKYVLQIVEDPEIRNLYELATQMAQSNIKQVEELFHHIDFPVPAGFADADLNQKAPRLFTDHFLLYFLNEMASNGMVGYGLSMSVSVSSRVREFNKNGFNQAAELYEKSLELMQTLNIFEDFPKIPIPGTPEFAHQQSFMISFVKPPRSLDILEISSIFANLKKSIMCKALCIAFSQVANLKDVREIMSEFIEIVDKNIEEFTNVLHNDFLTSPRMWDTDITDSKVPPFSDRLMLTLVAALTSLAISNYGSGLSICSRMDLAPIYSGAVVRVGKLGLDISKVLIKYGWLQQPPLAANRKVLSET